MAGTATRTPKAFISYSWDSPDHREWVRRLATRLRADGVDVRLDLWHAAPGDQLPAFMEREIRENDFVLIICTGRYKQRSDARGGGVGYEGDIMAGEVFTARNQRKFIPVLASGEWADAAPSWLLGKFYIDLRGPEAQWEASYQQLLGTLLGEAVAAPPIGARKGAGAVTAAAAAAGGPALKEPAAGTLNRYKVIAFDLDGTLLRGLQFSWTLVWEALGYSREFARRGMQRYRAGRISYAEWCKWACEMFIARGLTRERIREIAGTTKLTSNFHLAMRTLKREGLVTALVSGGIDTFLEDKIPDYKQWFDYVFINRLVFDENGFLRGVDATQYDFEGKAEAVELVCREKGFSRSEAVFVGEGFNDDHVAAVVGLSIAYPPTSQGISTIADVAIDRDDLTAILEHVITH